MKCSTAAFLCQIILIRHIILRKQSRLIHPPAKICLNLWHKVIFIISNWFANFLLFRDSLHACVLVSLSMGTDTVQSPVIDRQSMLQISNFPAPLILKVRASEMYINIVFPLRSSVRLTHWGWQGARVHTLFSARHRLWWLKGEKVWIIVMNLKKLWESCGKVMANEKLETRWKVCCYRVGETEVTAHTFGRSASKPKRTKHPRGVALHKCSCGNQKTELETEASILSCSWKRQL